VVPQSDQEKPSTLGGASTNLLDWITLTNFTGTNTVLKFTDPDAASLDRRFYRARQ